MGGASVSEYVLLLFLQRDGIGWTLIVLSDYWYNGSVGEFDLALPWTYGLDILVAKVVSDYHCGFQGLGDVKSNNFFAASNFDNQVNDTANIDNLVVCIANRVFRLY